MNDNETKANAITDSIVSYMASYCWNTHPKLIVHPNVEGLPVFLPLRTTREHRSYGGRGRDPSDDPIPDCGERINQLADTEPTPSSRSL